MLFLVENGVMPTTAMRAAVASGTAIKTLLQAKPFNLCKLVEFGISHDGHASCTKFEFDVVETDVAATVTALADADVTKLGENIADSAAASVAGLTLGTSATGFTASAEGSITAIRTLVPAGYLLPTQADKVVIQYPLGCRPTIQIAKFARVRVLAAANGTNVRTYMVLEV